MVAPLSTRSLRNSSTTAWVPASSFSGTMSRTMSYWRCGFGVVTRVSSFWIAPVSAGREARLWTVGPVPSQGCGSVRRGGFLGQTVETVHGDVDSLGHEDGESVYRRRDRLVHDGAFLLREAREHVRVEGLAGLEIIAAHAEAQARDEVRPEAVDHGLQALLAAGGARAPEAEGSDRERRVVGDDEETVKRDVVLRREALHGLSRGVHVGLGPGHDHAAVEPVETGRTAGGLLRERLHDVEADVVPRAGIPVAGVAESHHEDDPVRAYFFSFFSAFGVAFGAAFGAAFAPATAGSAPSSSF